MTEAETLTDEELRALGDALGVVVADPVRLRQARLQVRVRRHACREDLPPGWAEGLPRAERDRARATWAARPAEGGEQEALAARAEEVLAGHRALGGVGPDPWAGVVELLRRACA